MPRGVFRILGERTLKSHDSFWRDYNTFPIPASLPVSRVRDSFNEDGTPNDAAYEKRAADFLGEVMWFTEAIADRKTK
jgi:hypothetical protein